MARIRCKYLDCAFLDDNYCSAALIELDSNKGCLTYSPNAETPTEEGWDDNNDESEDWENLDDVDGEDSDEDEDEPWMNDDDDEM